MAQVGYRIPKGPGWYFSDEKSDALPPEVSGAPPGERLAWHRAIPTDIDPWSRPGTSGRSCLNALALAEHGQA